MIGLACSGFARHYSRNHYCFLFLWVLRCFTSPRSLYPPYIFRRESPGHHEGPGGVSPFGDPRITALLSAPRGLSQIYTSFFGSRCQGIHRLLLKTSTNKITQQRPMIEPTTPKGSSIRTLITSQQTHRPRKEGFVCDWRCSRPLCSSQNTGGTPTHPRRSLEQE